MTDTTVGTGAQATTDAAGAGSTGTTSTTGVPAGFRVEHDTMGDVLVPADALYRAQTQRAVENFPISGTRLERGHIEALARIKKAAARANAELGVLEQDVADAIVAAADDVASGARDDQFPVDVFQTGSGTSSNMNTNEVLATLATQHLGRPVHPNDHVNASQSSNDVFPTSVHVAATAGVVGDLVPALEHLAAALERKAEAFAHVVKSGRTHLMDATPVTLGQEFGGYAAAVRYGVERLQAALPRVAEVPLGGTAVGTGINTPAGFPQRVIALLREDTGLPLTEARDHFEAQSARDGLVELSGALRTIAVSLTKICNDLRWMGSGPNTGLGEIFLPDLQPGSSIMPGKVNPVVPEAVLMVAARVVGNDATVAWAGASGSFELNVQIPVIALGVLESVRLLANASRLLADRTVDGIVANEERARAYAESSPSIVTPLNRAIGYEAAAKVAKHAVAHGVTVRQAVVDLGFVERGEVTEPQLDEALDVMSMTRPPQP
ncbi:class II fumarate hydratase [Actinotalea solisilvae]|uniref:class II fumarate hydratase n=1 Tax=Actinotalea solisilvae TaxID=2072922 RepID=UPI0018F12BDA|nr:class II fumarate hydratase [Actinotalea solisilvae]